MVVQCPYCGFKEVVPEEYAGMTGECSNCGRDYLLQKRETEASHPVTSFLLGFFFSIIGILVAYIIDKKNVGNAVLGFVVSLVLWLFIVGGATCMSREAGRRAAGATDRLSAQEGQSIMEEALDISEDTIRRIGED